MKAYKIELLIIDHDQVGELEIASLLENVNFPNDCISPRVQAIDSVDIGEWRDDHPLNLNATAKAEYLRLFPRP